MNYSCFFSIHSETLILKWRNYVLYFYRCLALTVHRDGRSVTWKMIEGTVPRTLARGRHSCSACTQSVPSTHGWAWRANLSITLPSSSWPLTPRWSQLEEGTHYQKYFLCPESMSGFFSKLLCLLKHLHMILFFHPKTSYLHFVRELKYCLKWVS